jgi:hypothetical protein
MECNAIQQQQQSQQPNCTMPASTCATLEWTAPLGSVSFRSNIQHQRARPYGALRRSAAAALRGGALRCTVLICDTRLACTPTPRLRALQQHDRVACVLTAEFLTHATAPSCSIRTTAQRIRGSHAHQHYDRASQQHDRVVCLFAARSRSTSPSCSICATADHICGLHTHQHCDCTFQQRDRVVWAFAAGLHSISLSGIIGATVWRICCSIPRSRLSATRSRGVPLRGEIALNLALLQYLLLAYTSTLRVHLSAARSRDVGFRNGIALDLAL